MNKLSLLDEQSISESLKSGNSNYWITSIVDFRFISWCIYYK